MGKPWKSGALRVRRCKVHSSGRSREDLKSSKRYLICNNECLPVFEMAGAMPFGRLFLKGSTLALLQCVASNVPKVQALHTSLTSLSSVWYAHVGELMIEHPKLFSRHFGT